MKNKTKELRSYLKDKFTGILAREKWDMDDIGDVLDLVKELLQSEREEWEKAIKQRKENWRKELREKIEKLYVTKGVDYYSILDLLKDEK